MKRVVLFLPPYAGAPLGPPAGLLSLAASLEAAGYDPRIVDAAVEPDYLGAIARELPGALAFGVSLLTGPMIQGAVAASLAVRRARPDLPIVFGGWHPSLKPEQTLAESFVDVVVRNQGEATLVEVLRRIESGQGLEGCAGTTYKSGGRIHANPDRPALRLETLALPAYHRIDFDAYERASGERKLPYASSVGCPYACSYCTDTVFYNRRFNALGAARVVREVTELAARHRLDEVALLDSNFLVDTRRAVEIGRGFIEARLGFRWTFQASTDLLCRMSDADVRLLGESGVSHIGFGTESASEAVLAKMRKFHQRVEDMFETARKCRQAGIRATFNLIFGFPGEQEHDRAATIRVMGSIARQFDNVTFSPNLFTPYPGIPVWPELHDLGLAEPATLAGWQSMALGGTPLPWLGTGERERIERSMEFFLLENAVTKAGRRALSPAWRLGLSLLRRPLEWRLAHQRFEWPLELWLARTRRNLAMRRSLLTGRVLGPRLTGSRA
jgi:radical SAM superfamily enzyme YgiQ (UPF0313 family)